MLEGQPEVSSSRICYDIGIDKMHKCESPDASLLNVCTTLHHNPGSATEHEFDIFVAYPNWILADDQVELGIAGIAPIDRGFAEPNATWRQLPLHPGRKVEVEFWVERGELEWQDDVGQFGLEVVSRLQSMFRSSDHMCHRLQYIIYSGGRYPTMTIGQFYDAMEMIRGFSKADHIWFEQRAAEGVRVRRLLHERLLSSTAFQSDGGPGGVRCEVCEWSSCCDEGCGDHRCSSHCRISSLELSEALSVCWPLDNDMFRRIGGLNEHGAFVSFEEHELRRAS